MYPHTQRVPGFVPQVLVVMLTYVCVDRYRGVDSIGQDAKESKDKIAPSPQLAPKSPRSPHMSSMDKVSAPMLVL